MLKGVRDGYKYPINGPIPNFGQIYNVKNFVLQSTWISKDHGPTISDCCRGSPEVFEDVPTILEHWGGFKEFRRLQQKEKKSVCKESKENSDLGSNDSFIFRSFVSCQNGVQLRNW